MKRLNIQLKDVETMLNMSGVNETDGDGPQLDATTAGSWEGRLRKREVLAVDPPKTRLQMDSSNVTLVHGNHNNITSNNTMNNLVTYTSFKHLPLPMSPFQVALNNLTPLPVGFNGDYSPAIIDYL